MEGFVLWSSLILLFFILLIGCKNEWMGIRFLFNRDPEKAKEFEWESHRGYGRISMPIALLWSVFFIAKAPVMSTQYTPGINIILVLSMLGLAVLTWVSGWFLRRRRRRMRLMIHQAIGYFFVMIVAFLFVLILDEHVFTG